MKIELVRGWRLLLRNMEDLCGGTLTPTPWPNTRVNAVEFVSVTSLCFSTTTTLPHTTHARDAYDSDGAVGWHSAS
jgi:hypothetical protein